MRFAYVQPFVESARKILAEAVSGRIVAGDLRLSSAAVPSRGVTAIVGVTGEGEGRVIFDMDRETALRIASAMSGEPFDELDELAKDTLSELAGMMTGNAVSVLNDGGHCLRVSPPTLFAGENVSISGRALEALVVPLDTPFGEVAVNVAIATS